MGSGEIIQKAEQIVTPIISGMGYSLVDCEYINDQGRWVLRLYIDRNDGANVTIDDCAKVSRVVSTSLDVEGVINNRYSLEVSSPGLNRPLKNEADFQKYAGKKIRLKTREPLNGRANYFGTLTGMNGSNIVMNVDGVEYSIPINILAKARLEI